MSLETLLAQNKAPVDKSERFFVFFYLGRRNVSLRDERCV